jgi:hypothetical protein
MCQDTQADAFKRLWYGGPYESGEAFINRSLQHFRSLESEDRQAFKAAVHDFARAHNMENKQPIRALLEALDTEPK